MILKQASAAAFGMLLSATSWSAEITEEFTRAFSGEDLQRIQLIFRIEGDGTSEYAVFAQGPSLIGPDVTESDVLADPQISLLLDGDPIASNNDWEEDPSADRTAEVAASYNITLATQDAAMVRNLGAGLYTVVVTGADGGTGITRVGAADVSDIPSSGEPPAAGSCDGLLTESFYASIADQLDDGNTRTETDQIIGCVGEDDVDPAAGEEIRIYADTVNSTAIWVYFFGDTSFDSEFLDSGGE
jgi:hypothetical protein